MAKRSKKSPEEGKANRDPITEAPGAHPVGVGVGGASAGVAGAAIGGAIGGPLGAVVGAAVGTVAGGLRGKAAAELVNPTVEDAYWKENYKTRPYALVELRYEHWRPAYKYGWESRMMHQGKQWEDVEPKIASGWERARGESGLGWNDAKPAARDAWDRLENSSSHGGGHVH